MLFALYWKLAGAFRFELKISVLETDVLPVETTRLCEKIWSERRDLNPQHSVWKTATQPFEFRSQKLVHRERFELSQLQRATVLQTACLADGDRCVNKIFCVK